MAEELGVIILRTNGGIAAGTSATITKRVPQGRRFEIEDIRTTAIVTNSGTVGHIGVALPGPNDPLAATVAVPGLHLIEGEMLVGSKSVQDGNPCPIHLLGGDGRGSAGVATRRTVGGNEEVSVKLSNGTNVHANPATVSVVVALIGRYVS